SSTRAIAPSRPAPSRRRWLCRSTNSICGRARNRSAMLGHRLLLDQLDQLVLVDLAVAPAGARADEVGAEALSGMADPADPPGGHAGDQRVRRHVFCHHGPRGDQGVGADVVAAHAGVVGLERSAAPDPGLTDIALVYDLRARVRADVYY